MRLVMISGSSPGKSGINDTKELPFMGFLCYDIFVLKAFGRHGLHTSNLRR